MVKITEGLGEMGSGLQSVRNEAYAAAERYLAIINHLEAGVMPGNIPWGDPRFQEMLMAAWMRLLKHKADAGKLAIIKEVFGGK